ncbi:hypothetical protein FC65_GL000604 [Ligilactobacillus acidipiscis DSM 15836]|uniref:Zinc-ribbon domain-containing protein n=1 Tax=Ligilactobacillus acidipiscis DSM 15836 TaxID=1423716 RepID=A0ABR5PIX4_9LACO|nr:zinc ribbon domain-containing protein [Ligilactobacillus acidipiscis]KRM24598.1 hypothetical protein FC65_GL000604 [Ligilactobacillus acidipiscis DSM 15836]GAW64024.1 hypothetical protein Lacidipiscis_01213 [Ligilactobacillus acidipiscis]GEN20602.1 hypothetical protein LAC02_38830 [Ligilactobacillus acidipiscis]
MFDNYYVVCSNCQARNPLTNDFCNDCGEKLVKNSDSSKGVVTVFQKMDEGEKIVSSSSNLTTDNSKDADGETESNEQEQLSNETQKRFCPNCGNETVNGAKFCPICGFDLHNLNKNKHDPTDDVQTNNYQYNEDINQNSTDGKIIATIRNTNVGKIVSIVLAIFFIVVGIWLFKQHEAVTNLPNGVDTADAVLKHNAPENTDTILKTIRSDTSLASETNYIVSVYKNTRTGGYVFPVQAQETNKLHYCYVTKVDTHSMIAIDIDDSSWICKIPDGQGIQGNNPYKEDYKVNTAYYNQNIENFLY